MQENFDIEQVWQQFGQKLKHFIASKVSDPDIVEELSQELLIRSYQNIATLRDSSRLESWLYGIARNLVNDHYRKTNPKKQFQSLDDERFFEPHEDSYGQLSNQELAHSELSHCIAPFIAQLPEQYRAPLNAIYIEGLSQKDLAEQLNVSHSTIKSQTQRARAQLRKQFLRCCDFSYDTQGNVIDYLPKSKLNGCQLKTL